MSSCTRYWFRTGHVRYSLVLTSRIWSRFLPWPWKFLPLGRPWRIALSRKRIVRASPVGIVFLSRRRNRLVPTCSHSWPVNWLGRFIPGTDGISLFIIGRQIRRKSLNAQPLPMRCSTRWNGRKTLLVFLILLLNMTWLSYPVSNMEVWNIRVLPYIRIAGCFWMSILP